MEGVVAAYGDGALPLPRRREGPAVGSHTLRAAHPAIAGLNPPAAVVHGGRGGEVNGRARVEVNRTCGTHDETLLRLSESCAAEMRETREWTGVLAGQSRDDDSSRFQQQSQHGRPVLAYVRVPAVLKARIRGGQLKQPSPSRCIPSPVLPFPRDSSCTLSLPHDRCFGIFGRGAPASRRFQQQSCGLQAIRFLPQRWWQSLVRRNTIGEERR